MKKSTVFVPNDDQTESLSEEEFVNPVNSTKGGLTLSAFSLKNQRKVKFQEEYYRTSSNKKYPVKSRLEMTYERIEEVDTPRNKQPVSTVNESAKIPEPFGTPVNEALNYGTKIAAKMGNINGMYIDEDDAKYFKMPNSMQITNQRDYLKASSQLQGVIDEQAEIDAKAAKAKNKPRAKKKAPAKAGKDVEPEVVQPLGPPGEPLEASLLRTVIRSERFEDRLLAQTEIENMQRRLYSEGIELSNTVLTKAMYLPEDEEYADDWNNDKIGLISSLLFKNPFPTVKKKKGKKKK